MKREGWKPIDYANVSVETMMKKFKANELPPINRFHYHQGVFLSGVYQIFCLNEKHGYSKDEFFQYIKDWVDSLVDDNGKIHGYHPGELDDIQPGILLYPLYKRTGKEKYRIALEELAALFDDYPRIEEGGFFHKIACDHQMWLDGLYMGGPFMVEYGTTFSKPEMITDAVFQVKLMKQKTCDEATGLWYHAYDDLKVESWADPKTGRAPEFWGRSIGWVPVAILDEMRLLEKDSKSYQELARVVKDLLLAICRFQQPNGLWYQVVNKPKEKGNWPEISCSCLYTAAICRAVQFGILPKDYLEQALLGYDAVIESLRWDENRIYVQDVCIGTGVGDYQFYCERPTSTNDLHGVGAFLIMCAWVQEVMDEFQMDR